MHSIPSDRQKWLPELKAAVNAVNVALAGREATAEMLFQLGPEVINSVEGHRLIIQYYEFGYLFDPELDEPGSPECGLLIAGDKLVAGWLIKEEDLANIFG